MTAARKRMCPRGVRTQSRRPSSTHWRTVRGETPQYAAASSVVIQRLAGERFIGRRGVVEAPKLAPGVSLHRTGS